MSKKEVTVFLNSLKHQSDLRDKLRTLPKQEVLKYAKESGYDFTEQEFDETVWGLEILLADKLGEIFDFNFSLWETMWGKYYLDYLIDNVIDCLSSAEIYDFLNRQSEELLNGH
jgi:predicted ribosomally synthesized peptide with nif11-like leader